MQALTCGERNKDREEPPREVPPVLIPHTRPGQQLNLTPGLPPCPAGAARRRTESLSASLAETANSTGQKQHSPQDFGFGPANAYAHALPSACQLSQGEWKQHRVKNGTKLSADHREQARLPLPRRSQGSAWRAQLPAREGTSKHCRLLAPLPHSLDPASHAPSPSQPHVGLGAGRGGAVPLPRTGRSGLPCSPPSPTADHCPARPRSASDRRCGPEPAVPSAPVCSAGLAALGPLC